MKTSNIVDFALKDGIFDALTEILRTGAQGLIAVAVEAALEVYMAQYAALRTVEDNAGVVRNGYHPERPIQTGIGPVNVRMPKVRSKDGTPFTFHSALVPPVCAQDHDVGGGFTLAVPEGHIYWRDRGRDEGTDGPCCHGIFCEHNIAPQARLGQGI